ncbi:MAG: FAD-dependent oxidoreductase [Sulfurimonadaceae bacterium]|jgi:NADH dehydrogenase FAD-containing subunit|nr:FAD-dependent oxidoreductase [Sulfurimonadaceae bacterium]
MNQSRRNILKASGLSLAAIAVTGCGAAVAGTPEPTKSNAVATKALMPKSTGKRVVVVGGGWGGLSAARKIKEKAPESEVIVLEKRDVFTSCPLSNEWLVDEIPLDFLTRNFFTSAKEYGYKFIQTTVTDIDRNTRSVDTTCGAIDYDYLVLAPGIRYDYTAWFGDDTQMAERCRQECPPALVSGSEHAALKKILEEFEGGNFVISVPDGAYRCPPAPYERAALVANYFRKNNINGKVIILDPKEKPAPKGPGFMAAYKELYADIVEYHPHSLVKGVNLDTKELRVDVTDKDLNTKTITMKFDAANLIPTNAASELIAKAGVSMGKAGWGQMKAPTFQTLKDERVFVIGDSVGGYPYPKSGSIANGQGHIVADQIANIIKGHKALTDVALPVNTCYSMLNDTEGISVSATFSLVDDKDAKGNPIKKIKGDMKANNQRSTALGKGTHNWYQGMMTDIFGS